MSYTEIRNQLNKYYFQELPDIAESIRKNTFEKLDKYCLEAKKDANGLKIDPLVHPDDAPDLTGWDKTDVARALMAGVSEKLKETLKMLEKIDVVAKSVVMVGGPSQSAVWRSVISEITGIEVKAASGAFTGALGAAKIAFGLNL